MKIGSVISVKGKKYRIIQSFGPNTVLLIELGINKYHFERADINDLVAVFGAEEAEDPYKPQAGLLSDDEMNAIKTKQEKIQAILTGLSDYSRLASRTPCTGIDDFMKEFGFTRCIAHKYIRRYLQSGMDMYSLQDGRKTAKRKSGDMFSGLHKGGHKFADGSTRVPIDPEKERRYFEEGFKMIQTESSLSYILNTLNRKYFSTVLLDENGNFEDIIPLPANESLSEKRFRKFVKDQLGPISVDKYKMGIRYRRNNDRILFGTAQTGCTHPGAILEIDACEVDMIIVGDDHRQDLGRPVLYFAVDVFSCRIVGSYIGFENNSFLGATSLLNDIFFGFGIIPNSIRVDHGAEWVSKDLRRLGKEMGINVSIVAPGTGSMKGLVENSFHVYQKRLRNQGRPYGAIFKEYESRHYEKASLMLNEMKSDVNCFIETFNKSMLKSYELSLPMIQDGTRAIPVELWDFGIKYGAMPRIVTDPMKNLILFSLCIPRQKRTGFSLSRKGFTLDGLTYISQEARIKDLIQRTHYKTQPEEYEVRIDPRTVGHIWVRIGTDYFQVPLGEKHDSLQSFAHLTWREYELIRNDQKNDKAAYAEENRHQQMRLHELSERMMKDSKRKQNAALDTKNNKKDIRDARLAAQQNDRRENVLGGGPAWHEEIPALPDKTPSLTDSTDSGEMSFEDFYY